MLVQFAVLGSRVIRALVRGHDKPTVGLLNVGSEDMKGREELRMAAAFYKSKISRPFIPGLSKEMIFLMGTVDVVVTDGFTGNIALKTAEGVSKLISTDMLKRSLKSSLLGRLGAIAGFRFLETSSRP
jgi:glycerol-3-phosphate acyltransferase PlsX